MNNLFFRIETLKVDFFLLFPALAFRTLPSKKLIDFVCLILIVIIQIVLILFYL